MRIIYLTALLIVGLLGSCSYSTWEMEEEEEFVDDSRTSNEIEKNLSGYEELVSAEHFGTPPAQGYANTIVYISMLIQVFQPAPCCT